MDNIIQSVMQNQQILLIIGIVVALILVIMVIRGMFVVPEAETHIVERIGAFHKNCKTGIHFLFPFIDRVSKKISLREKVREYDPQSVITKDNVTMQIDTVIFYQVSDPKLYAYGITDPDKALENITATTLRNIIGELDLDETLASRDTINTKIRIALDEATDSWGLKVTRVEVRNITPPDDIKEAMEKQMRAEREKRQAILRATGQKEAEILKAQGEKEATILRAEAERRRVIEEAAGAAEAIRLNTEAEAKGIIALKEAKADETVLTMKSLEALTAVANGQATTVIVPSQLQDLSGLVTSVGAIMNTNNNSK